MTFGQDSHDDPPSSSHRSLDRDFIAILVFCFRHIEHGKDGRDDNENRSIDKVTSRTDSLADAKYQCERWIVSDAPVFVEKTLRLEFLWVWVFLGVVKDCPGIFSDRHHSDCYETTYHALAIIIDPFWTK